MHAAVGMLLLELGGQARCTGCGLCNMLCQWSVSNSTDKSVFLRSCTVTLWDLHAWGVCTLISTGACSMGVDAACCLLAAYLHSTAVFFGKHGARFDLPHLSLRSEVNSVT